MIDIQAGSIEKCPAVLASILITLEDIQTGELDLLFREAVKETEHDNVRNSNLKRDGLEHSRLWVRERKMSPTQKIMREKVIGAIACNNLGMPLIEERQGTAGGTGVDGLPQPVEDKNRLIEQCIHDLAIKGKIALSSCKRHMSIKPTLLS